MSSAVQTISSLSTVSNGASPSASQNSDSRDNTQSGRPSDSQRSTTAEPQPQPDPHQGPSIQDPPHIQRPQGEPARGKESQPLEQITITINLPATTGEDEGWSQPQPASFHTTAKPEHIRRLFGIPEFQPREQQPIYSGQRNYDYEEKYPADKPNEENEPDARFFKVYLDEAEIFDQEKLRTYRDNLDSLLVFAALFSAVVTTFAVQTSQALQPDQSLITNYLLLHQIEILKAVGNSTAIARIADSPYLPDTMTHSSSDIWINGLFFTSLGLSLSTALLSVLAKQWLQAYDSSTSGSAQDRALVRHLRFMGLTKWKLDEIIGALPLVLHVSVAVFLIGLTVFLWALYPSLAWIIIVISGISFMLYLASLVLPAIDIESFYRILKKGATKLWTVLSAPVISLELPQYIRVHLRKALAVTTDTVPKFGGDVLSRFQKLFASITPSSSLLDDEQSTVQTECETVYYLHKSIAWLYDMSSNTSVQRIAAQAIAGYYCRPGDYHPYISYCLRTYCTNDFIETVFEGLFDGNDIPPQGDKLDWNANSSAWVRATENLSNAFTEHLEAPFLRETLLRGLFHACCYRRVMHAQFILHHTRDVEGFRRDLYEGSALLDASQCGHLEIVRLLVENGVNVDLEGGSALQAASSEGHLEVVRDEQWG